MGENVPVIITYFNKLWRELTQKLPTQKRSRLDAEVGDAELRRSELERLMQFQENMRQKYGEQASSAKAIQEMREKRDNEIA
jgi:hypothetical protein